jgi:putative ABC transport system substrate-binding protein
MIRKIIGLGRLAGLILLFVAAAQAAQPVHVARVGILLPTGLCATVQRVQAFRQELRRRGYMEGRNVVLECRHGEGKVERLGELATELVRLRVDVILAETTPAIQAVRQATQTIPIVMSMAVDPVGAGLVASLARPGGNITGLSAMGTDLSGKRVELFKEAIPKISRAAILYDPFSVSLQLTEAQAAAAALRLQLEPFEIRNVDNLSSVFAAVERRGAEGFVTLPSIVLGANPKALLEFAAKGRLPAIYPQTDFVNAGGLMSYGTNYDDLMRRAAYYVDKILKGAKPADLPVEQPTKFEFIINLKAAKQIGLTIPPSVLARADRVIK